jgi:hypothetical protein
MDDRERVFRELLEDALDDGEIRDSLGQPEGLTRDRLRAAAEARRGEILQTAAEHEAAYDLARQQHPSGHNPARVLERGRPARARLLDVIVVVWLLMAFTSVGIIVAINDRWYRISAIDRHADVVAGWAGVAALVWLAALVVTYLVRMLFGRLEGASRDTVHVAAVTSVTILAMIMASMAFASTLAALVSGWRRGYVGDLEFPEVAAIVLVLGLAAGIAFPWGTTITVDSDEFALVAERRDAWRAVLRAEGILTFLRAEINAQAARRFATVLTIDDAPGLRNLTDLSYHVHTRSAAQLVRVAGGLTGGSIALCGPRGVGKTELLRAFCTGGYPGATDARDLAVVVSAPVTFDRLDFVLHLYAAVCEKAATYASELGSDDRRQLLAEVRAKLESVRYLQTRTSDVGGALAVRSVGLQYHRGVSLARRPWAYPEVVDDLKRFLERIGRVLEQRRLPGASSPHLVIGIDELDRIHPAARARDFLNELKAVFDVHGCLFLVTVSDEALQDADLAGPARNAFDSVIDEVVRVDPLDFREAKQLLAQRVIGMPEPFQALAYALSGGLPRDLLRTARATAIANDTQTTALSAVTRHLLLRELARIQRTGHAILATENAERLPTGVGQLLVDDGPQWLDTGLLRLAAQVRTQLGAAPPDVKAMCETLANNVFFLATVEQVFSDDLDEAAMSRAADPGFAGSYDALARIQRAIGHAEATVPARLTTFRAAWNLASPVQDRGCRTEPGVESAAVAPGREDGHR